MKKILVLVLIGMLIQTCSLSKDYAKMQIKEMKHAQKYGTTETFLNNYNSTKYNMNNTISTVRDPKLLKLSNYETIDSTKYANKIKQDNEKYSDISKTFKKVSWLNYNSQARGEDYYKLYRIAEKIIRANKLDYINWRIGIQRNSTEVNAFTTGTNYIEINTALYDTFIDNEDALAIIIGHEMGHALLGHQARQRPTVERMQRMGRLAAVGNGYALSTYAVLRRKYLIESKNMEYSADTEGAKLAAKAGYNLNNGREVLAYFDTLGRIDEKRSTHPDTAKRIENYNTTITTIPEKAYEEWGQYNIFNTDVLKVTPSSDRKSFVISCSPSGVKNNYYHLETAEEIYTRFAYSYYLNQNFDKSIEYFNKVISINPNNAIVYLYSSYANEELYNKSKNNKYMEQAKINIEKAYSIDSSNSYIKEQYNHLK